jgi:hypothetical protein
MIEEWHINLVGRAKRDYHIIPDLNIAYMNSVTGWLAGLMARVGIFNHSEQPANLLDAIHFAEKESKPISQKAGEKWEILSRLKGLGKNEG